MTILKLLHLPRLPLVSRLLAIVLAATASAFATDPVTVSFRDSNLSADEATPQVSLPVRLSSASAGVVTVTAAIRTASTTASADDYTLDTTTLTFAPGEIEKSLRLRFVDDVEVETAEVVFVELTAATGATILNDPGAGLTDVCSVQINDNDDKPYAVLTQSSVNVVEGQRTLSLSAQLSWPSTQEIIIPLMLGNNAGRIYPLAEIPGDLGVLPRALVFPPGSTRQEFVVGINDDALVEGTEEISIALCFPGFRSEPITFIIDARSITLWQNLPFQLNPGQEGATCRIVIADDDSLPPSVRANTWQTAAINPTRQHLHAVTWTGSQYIAVGDVGTVITSPDGLAWTRRDSATKAGLSCIAWSGSEAIAVGNGVVIRSTDGIAWTVQHSPVRPNFNSAVLNIYGSIPRFFARSLPAFEGTASIAWTGQQFVVSSPFGSIATSSDGRVWQESFESRGQTTDMLWTGSELLSPSLFWNNRGQYAIDLLTSATGRDWTRRVSTLPAQSVSYSYLGLTLTSGTIIRSGDDIPMVFQPNITARLAQRANAPAGSATWVTAIRGSSTPGLYVGSEASPFSTAAAIRADDHAFEDVTWTGSQWVAVGDRIGTSADGITWSVPSQVGDVKLHSLVSGGGNTVAVGDYGAIVIIPEPAVAGEAATLVTMNQSMKDIIWAGTQYIAVGSGGTLLTSPDGLAWTVRDSGTRETLHAVACGEVLLGRPPVEPEFDSFGNPVMHPWDTVVVRTLVAIGSSGRIIISQDNGNSWAPVIHRSTAELRGITWTGRDHNEGQFVAVGADRTILTSPDGLTWTTRSLPALPLTTGTRLAMTGASALLMSFSPIWYYPQPIDLGDTTAANMLEDVTWSGTQFVAVGSQDSVFTSPDGVAWTQRSVSHAPRWSLDGYYYSGWDANPVSDLKRVAWTGNQWIAIGTHGSVITSADGVAWVDQDSGLYRNYYRGWPYALNYASRTRQNNLAASSSLSASSLSSSSLSSSSLLLNSSFSSLSVATSALIYWPYYQQAETLRGLAVAGDEIIAVGSFGRVLTSSDAQVWRMQGSPSGLNLNAVAMHGQQTIAVGDQGLVVSNSPSTALPTVSWAVAAQSVDEAETTVTLTAQLSEALAEAIDVPYNISGIAQADWPAPESYTYDYGLSNLTNTLHFEAGATTATLEVQIHEDDVQEGNETIFITLANPGAGVQVWSHSTTSLVIRASDQRPRIIRESADAIILAGQSHTFSIEAAAPTTTLSYQWYVGPYDNLLAIAGATSPSLTITDTQAIGARRYSVVTSNGNGTVSSNFQLITIAPGQGGTATVNEGSNITLIIDAPSQSLFMWWRQQIGDGSDTPRGSTNADGSSLTFTDAQPSDSGTYICTLQIPYFMTLRSSIVYGGYDWNYKDLPTPLEITYQLTVLPRVDPPEITTTTLLAGMVGVPYNLALTATNAPSSYTATGLPLGLRLNAATGEITGRPIRAGTYTLAIRARNSAGVSAITSLVLTIDALPIAGATGSYTAVVVGSADHSLDGRLDFTLAPSGAVTGKLILGTESHSFFSTILLRDGGFFIETSFARSAGIGRQRLFRDHLALSIRLDTTAPAFSGSLTRTGRASAPMPGASITGWRKVWHGSTNPATSHAGYYTALLLPAAAAQNATLDATTPGGSGFLSYTISPEGTLLAKGRLADGSAFAISTFIGPSGELGLYQVLDPRGSSLLGILGISVDAVEPSDRRVAGTLAWNLAARSTPARLATSLTTTVAGASYTSSKAQPIPGLIAPSAVILTLSEGVLSTPITVAMNLGTRGLASVTGNNPHRAWLVFDAKTGAFSAGFNPIASKHRRVTAQGMFSMSANGFAGAGYFSVVGSPSGDVQIHAVPVP